MSLIMTEYKDVKDMTEIDFYALKWGGVSFDFLGKKWFVHHMFDDYACTMDGEILLIFKRRILKPLKTTLGLYVTLCYEDDFMQKTVHDFVFETFNQTYEPCRLVVHKDGNKLNNHIDNLKYEDKWHENIICI